MTALSAARQLLAVAVEGLAAADRPAPERQFVTPGSRAVAECEQLTVAITRPSIPGTPGAETARARPVPQPRYVELRLDLLRCIRVDAQGLPPAELDQYAEELMADAEALRVCLEPSVLASAGRPAYVSPISTQGPEGGLVGLFCVVQLPL